MATIEVHIANAWTEAIAPASAILGVIVGGWFARGREQRVARNALRHASRLLLMEVQLVEVDLERIRKGNGSQFSANAPKVISGWDARNEALAPMGFLDWNQVHRTVMGLRLQEALDAPPPPGRLLDNLLAEVVATRKVLERYVAGPLEWPRMILTTRKEARAAKNAQASSPAIEQGPS